ncbi:MAG TPA: phage tail sheath C-terminal domain-containing protein [Steroidobacteraceae bacterium]|nr:phage tail sheath C-terminal domain-containing protein [Steroidobacteraceae bacterium]
MVERGAPGLELARSRTEPIIARLPSAVTAFVGRTLKGPVQRPVAVASFAEFQQVFGGLWQPSTLSYAVEQFFDHGGRRAVIVRVANGGRPPTITLPAGTGALRLAGVNPGSREYLRASVDYDGIPEGDTDRFNLVIQRVRSTGSELIEDQEIFRRVSLRQDSGRCLPDLLPQSRLTRAVEPLPEQRPDRSAGPGGSAIGYTFSNADGDDGGPLTDYDIIGSAAAGTGLFALTAADGFNFLCIPPLSRDHDIGLSALLVAGRYCRERHAMLIVDPPASWATARAALDGMRTWPFRSDNALMYYPRVQALDRLRGRLETFASCGAVAGMLARSDDISSLWSAAANEELTLRPGMQPAVPVCDADRLRLAQVGINTLSASRPTPGGADVRVGARTLAAGGSGFSEWKYLSARRLGLWVAASIERGTRWVLLEQNSPATWGSARSLVETFLEVLAEQGAFVGAAAADRYFVICDERVNRPDTIADGRVNLLFGFAPSRPGEFDAWLVTHQPAASRVRPVSVNRLATSRQRVEWEIETTILKKMDYR